MLRIVLPVATVPTRRKGRRAITAITEATTIAQTAAVSKATTVTYPAAAIW
jgi:hypothetical protein